MFDTTYLHIGLDKTGSKAIQFAFYENTEILNNSGFFYHITPDTVWHAKFASFFHEDPKQYNYNRTTGRNKKELSTIQTEDINYIKHLEEKIQQTNAKTMVLSYEGFEYLDELTLKKMYEYLTGVSNQIKVILYCRSPDSYAASAVSQRAISMNPLWNTTPIQPFKKIGEKFTRVFGYENMIVRKFSKDSLFQRDVRKDFFMQIGFDLSSAPEFILSDSGNNRSLCSEAIFVAAALRKRCEQEKISIESFYQRYALILQKIQGKAYSLSKNELNQVISCSQEHTEYLLKNFGIDFEINHKPREEQSELIFSPHFIDSIAEIIYTQKEFIGRLAYLDSISTMSSSERKILQIEVFNRSDCTWQSEGSNPINLSYHWQEKPDVNIIWEGLRTAIPTQGVLPGDSLKAEIEVEAPQKAGVYILVLTLVKEGVCWFESYGFEPAKTTVQVI